MEDPNQLPPGWIAHWDATHQRYLFVESESGHQQWEHPLAQLPPGQEQIPDASVGAAAPRTKRRQYAAEQLQAYSTPEPAPYPDVYQTAGPGHVPVPGPAPPFTPGLQNVDATIAQVHQQAQPGYYGQGQLAGQFAQMGLEHHRPVQLYTINLLSTLPNPEELQLPPPKMPLPATASISQEPTVNADPSYMRCTLGAVPTTAGLLAKTKLPFALVLSPNRSGGEVPLVSDTVIARCRRCRSYINPFSPFVDGGQRWKCVLCGLANEVPQLFDWDATTNSPADRYARHELHHAVVEYIAPTEYMVRPPQPLVYVFLIDVSHTAVQSGMLATATRTILESLDRIPNGDDRLKVAIIGFDISLYFFSLKADSPDVNMLVVSDVEDVFLPHPSDLLVNLTEARAAVETLLGRMQSLFADNDSLGSALGPALQAGFKMISSMGGKMVALSASLPTLGAGALKSREDAKLLGTPKESSLLQPGNSWYKTFAIECSRATVSVDMFLFGSAYQDVATLSVLPHYTSGSLFFYPGFNASRTEDAVKFATEFGGFLASPVGLEALTRVRTSRGVHAAGFHGNFFLRSTDLLAMPAVPEDQSYMIELEIDETITDPFVVFQCGILYTTALGERRIRVTTLAVPTSANISEIYAAADQCAVAAYLANKAVERVQTHKLEDARDGVVGRVTAILEAYKNTMTGGAAAGQLAIAQNLAMMPLLALGLLKHVALRRSSQIPSDLRAYAHTLLTTLPVQRLIPYLHPTFYSLHNMPPECGTIGPQGVILPPALPLSSERLERHGLYLIEDGQTIFLWVGREAVPQLIMDVFDLPAYAALHGGKVTLPLLDNPFSQRVNTVVNAVREMYRGVYYPALYVVKDDGEMSLRLWALSALILDRGDQGPSYQQWLGSLRDKLAGSSY